MKDETKTMKKICVQTTKCDNKAVIELFPISPLDFQNDSAKQNDDNDVVVIDAVAIENSNGRKQKMENVSERSCALTYSFFRWFFSFAIYDRINS